ncbi:MAG TPA: hypothetical protein VMI06_02850 [Terriglobia bacterium]|nr:hypothetical protein [Terriglobia bacterium]
MASILAYGQEVKRVTARLSHRYSVLNRDLLQSILAANLSGVIFFSLPF